MPLRWDPKLETGYRELDDQHRKLYRALSEIITAVQEHRSQSAVMEFLVFLQDYVLRHFETEESIMIAVGYPQLDSHRAAHAEFADEIAHIVASYKKHGHSSLVTIKLRTCAVAWLRDHIQNEDKKMAAFLQTVSGGRTGSGT